MTAPNAKTGEGKVTKPVKSIHIVVFACPNCGEEVEELKLCKECKSPMKVIQVIEKFGQEAEEYLDQLKKEGVWTDEYVSPSANKFDDGGISVDDVDELDIPINGIHPATADAAEEDLSGGLGDIFPDDDDMSSKKTDGSLDLDLMEALDKLDEEEENDVQENLPEL